MLVIPGRTEPAGRSSSEGTPYLTYTDYGPYNGVGVETDISLLRREPFRRVSTIQTVSPQV